MASSKQSKENQKNGQKDPKKAKRDRILTWIILGVIALEVVLIIFVMVKRQFGSGSSQNTASQENVSEESGYNEGSRDENVSGDSSEAEEAEPVEVNWHGKKFTAAPNSSGTLVLDYGNDSWWVEEGFVGQYSLTETTEAVEGVTETFSEAMIYSNSNIVWIVDDDVYSGQLFAKRYYDAAAHGYATTDTDNMPRAFDIDFVKIEDGKAVRFAADEEVEPTYIEIHAAEQEEPDPLREIYVVLERINDGQ